MVCERPCIFVLSKYLGRSEAGKPSDVKKLVYESSVNLFNVHTYPNNRKNASTKQNT